MTKLSPTQIQPLATDKKKSRSLFNHILKWFISGDIRIVLLLSDTLIVALVHIYIDRYHFSDGLGQINFMVTPLWILIFAFYGLYKRRISLSVVDEFPQIFQAVSMSTLIAIAFPVLMDFPVHPSAIIAVWFLNVLLIPLWRIPIRAFQTLLRTKQLYQRNTLVIGAGQVATIIAKKLVNQPQMGLKVIGFVDDDPPEILEREAMGLEIFRGEYDLELLVKKHNIRQVIIAFSAASYERMLHIIRECENLPVEFSIVPRLFEILTTNLEVDEIEGIPLLNLRKVSLEGVNLLLKRTLDIIFSSLTMIVLTPFFLILAILIKFDSPGPVFFRQKRIGKDGRPFEILKFRSMIAGAEKKLIDIKHLDEADGPLFQIKDDPRMTRIGRIIRKYSIDEFPQFLNVLRGEMSIVGPRPALPSEVEEYEDWHKRRLRTIPGITGTWQVLGRNEIPFDEMVKLDINYIQNWSLSLDAKLVFKTISAIFRKRGAH